MKNPSPLLVLTAISATMVAIGSLGAIAPADSILEPRSVVVRFADLDTNNVHDTRVLYDRIRLAAETVCSDLASQRRLPSSARYAVCVQDALGNAIRTVNRPLLNDYAAAHGLLPAAAPIRVKVARTPPGPRALF